MRRYRLSNNDSECKLIEQAYERSCKTRRFVHHGRQTLCALRKSTGFVATITRTLPEGPIT